MAQQSINIGVVGVGHLGEYHLKHLKKIKNSNLIGFFDIDKNNAKKIAESYDVPAYDSLDSLIENCAALSVVVPTKDHYSVAEACISAGKHVFLEKPICQTVEEADLLLALAQRKSVIIQVGHIERLNPALYALKGLHIKPKYIETHRLAPYTVRGTDVPVVLDLMIHDLDVLLALVNSPVKSIQASGVSIMTNSVDIANARLRFDNGVVANITASRIARDYVRKLRIFQQDMYITIDFLKGLTEVYRAIDLKVEDPNAIFSAPIEYKGKRRQIVYEKPPVKKIDALKLELENFVESSLGKSKPIVSGQAGRDALEVAMIIQNKIEKDIN